MTESKLQLTENNVPDVEKEISDLLRKEGKDYLTVTQIKDGLSPATLKSFGLDKKSSPTNVLKKLKPYFGNNLQNYTGFPRGKRTTYIGFKMSLDEILFKKIEQNPGLSLKQLRNSTPTTNKDVVALFHTFVKEGKISFTLREKDYVPLLRISEVTEEVVKHAVSDRAAFKAAYDEVGKGRDFVRIHRIREHLNWSREHFDRVLTDLRGDYTIQLHGGDPSIMSEKEIQDSFVDEKGRLRITVTWR